jgi:hypothetical protein
MILIVVLRWVVGWCLSFLTHLKLLARLPENHASFLRQLTLNALQSSLLTLIATFSAGSWGKRIPRSSAAGKRKFDRVEQGVRMATSKAGKEHPDRWPSGW